MVTQDWDRARWAWFLALIGGLTYFYAVRSGLSGLPVSIWKTSGVALLALWAALNARVAEQYWIAIVFAFGAAGDFLLAEQGLLIGGAIFALGHFIAITFYLNHRRRKFSRSQTMFAWLVTPLSLFIAWQLTKSESSSLAGAAMTYTAIVALMTAAAWTSRFPRFRTGLGAVAFLVSDLFIFAGEGGALPKGVASLFIWPLYFGGQALIAWGVVSTMSAERTGYRR